ncbi:MAG TPA: ABC transporter ATP-binding protein [Geminicoccaceae bacterium]
MLEIAGLDVHRGPSHVLRALSLDVPAGRITALIGANGAGKTTTLMAVSGLLAARAGRITLHADDRRHELTRLRPDEIVALGVAHCPEGRQVFASLTVEENLMIGAYHRRDRTAVASDRERMIDLFPVLGERSGQWAGSLSGGEQMMLAIGRALMARPRVLLLDEPSLGLAPNLVERIFATIREIAAEGITVLLVEQNAGAALELADRAHVIETGSVSRSGSGPELLRDPRVKDAYLGLAGGAHHAGGTA